MNGEINDTRESGKPGIIFLFLDGLGLGPPVESNPFQKHRMTWLEERMGSTLTRNIHVSREGILVKPIDACLGVEGVPQSATGQTTLFTGINSQAAAGTHLSAWPNELLRKIIEQESIFKKLKDHGFSCAFANAYSREYFRLVESGTRRHSASTLSVMAAGLPLKGEEELHEGRAVYWDITHEVSSALLPGRFLYRTPQKAGEIIASLSRETDFLMFESFLPDLVGHGKRTSMKAERLITQLLDPFIETIACGKEASTTLVISSDHGNLEDASSRGHNRNKVPLIAMGPGALHFDSAASIQDVTPCMIRLLMENSR